MPYQIKGRRLGVKILSNIQKLVFSSRLSLPAQTVDGFTSCQIQDLQQASGSRSSRLRRQGHCICPRSTTHKTTYFNATTNYRSDASETIEPSSFSSE